MMLCQWNAQASSTAIEYEKMDPSAYNCSSYCRPRITKSTDQHIPAATARVRNSAVSVRQTTPRRAASRAEEVAEGSSMKCNICTAAAAFTQWPQSIKVGF